MDAFRQRLALLAHTSTVVGDATLFSDLDRAKLASLRESWPSLPTETRRRLVAAMAELGEEKVEYNFSRALKLAMRDADAQVRVGAIEGLWEDEGEDLLAYLLDEALRDPDREVREAAVRALARFTRLAAEDGVSARWAAPLHDRLIELARAGESLELRRRALEALAPYTDDAEVTRQIERAYAAPEERLRMSALYAMGLSLDERWLDTVIEEMDNPSPGMRYEATKASGELGDRRAVPRLIERLGDDDREVQLAAIGSLGQIGGSASMNILKRLAKSKDDTVREAAEEALDEAAFMTDPMGLGGRLGGEERE